MEYSINTITQVKRNLTEVLFFFLIFDIRMLNFKLKKVHHYVKKDAHLFYLGV